MKLLVVGNSDKMEHILRNLDLTRPFLAVDDGPLIEALSARLIQATTIPNRPKVVRLDFSKHSFNPLEDMTYLKARTLAATLYTASPQGENTLTVRNGKRALARLLLQHVKRLDQLRITDKKDPGNVEAMDTIKDTLLSPILRDVFCRKPNIPFENATLLAPIDRAELGDFDAFVLANFLIGQFQGQVVVRDGGFYLREHHNLLVRQDRLICGASYFAELPASLRNNLMADTIPAGRCTWEDARELASYAGLAKDTVAFSEYVDRAIA